MTVDHRRLGRRPATPPAVPDQRPRLQARRQRRARHLRHALGNRAALSRAQDPTPCRPDAPGQQGRRRDPHLRLAPRSRRDPHVASAACQAGPRRARPLSCRPLDRRGASSRARAPAAALGSASGQMVTRTPNCHGASPRRPLPKLRQTPPQRARTNLCHDAMRGGIMRRCKSSGAAAAIAPRRSLRLRMRWGVTAATRFFTSVASITPTPAPNAARTSAHQDLSARARGSFARSDVTASDATSPLPSAWSRLWRCACCGWSFLTGFNGRTSLARRRARILGRPRTEGAARGHSQSGHQSYR